MITRRANRTIVLTAVAVLSLPGLLLPMSQDGAAEPSIGEVDVTAEVTPRMTRTLPPG